MLGNKVDVLIYPRGVGWSLKSKLCAGQSKSLPQQTQELIYLWALVQDRAVIIIKYKIAFTKLLPAAGSIV